MADPTGIGGHLGNGRDRTPEQHRAKADELMRKIEDEELIPPWCWGPLTDTVAHLSELGDDLAWIVTAYLSSVVVRGPAMFRQSHRQLDLHSPVHPEYGVLRCRCGEDAPAERPVTRSGRTVRTARCPACRAEVVEFDGVPFDRPTLLAPGLVQ